jgi:hypothetical protein
MSFIEYKKELKLIGSVETGMNLYVLTKTMKIIQYTKDPASGPLRGTAGEEFLFFCH